MKKVKITDYELLTTLGMGTFGRVRLARNKQSGKFMAVKLLKKIDILKSKQMDHVQNQSSILSSLSHPFIVQMEGFSQDNRYLYYVMEYVVGAQIILIFEYLHERNIIFRDLKPQNLLIAQDGYLKLTDFSFAKVVQTRTFTLCGTPQYLAPQILMNQGHGKAVDWWTLGILIYEMNAGIDPFTDEDPMIIYQNILKGKVRFPKDMDKEAKAIIKHLLVADAAKRLGSLKGGADDVKQHRYLAKVDFKLLLAKKVQMASKPNVKGAGDTSNFKSYPNSETEPTPVKTVEDPFLDW